ncbi:MAG TPA: autotransporter assembly complex family protein, partial [Rhodanobacteraceae bacterium]|nr:autotransporter assembly complex family protein [Rhodanobacteraceae bacterium]
DGPARALKPVQAALEAFAPRAGQALDHAAYERGKTAIQAALLASGYLDAQITEHRVEVSRGTRKATIRLAWEPGRRYRFGGVRFEGAQFPEGFLVRYIPWHEGEDYSQDALLALQRRLTDADYFALVEVSPDIEQARDGVVPISVHLAPAKRSIYSGGVFVGTDTGAGLRGGLERRWMNTRGHKFKTEVIAAQRLKTVSALYSIPLPGPDDRSFNFGANYKDENTRSSQARTASLVANETRQWLGFTRTLGLHLVSGDFSFGDLKGNSTILFPEAALTRKRADDALFVREGYSFTIVARAAKKDLLADTDFAQLRADAKWVHALGTRQRLILRGSAGASWVSDFDALPPDLRFFAGGDRSIRGYGYQAIGPRRTIARRDGGTAEQVIGGENLAVASAEYEFWFRPRWGIATFLDAGDAFTGTDFKLKLGTGVGLRWLSPVGMVRVDLGVPVGDRYAHGVQLHLVIGPDL